MEEVKNLTDDKAFVVLVILLAILSVRILIDTIIKGIRNEDEEFVPDPDAPDFDRNLLVISDGFPDASGTFLKYLVSRAESELSNLDEPLGGEEIESYIIAWRNDFRHSFYRTFHEDPDSEIRHKYVMSEFIRILCESGVLKSLKKGLCEHSSEHLVVEEV